MPYGAARDRSDGSQPADNPHADAGVGRALANAVPMAVWVFAAATLPMIVLVQQWADEPIGPWLPGLAAVLLGVAYGLCLREGLVDVERFAPRGSRALVIGVFYVCTYLGFGLPVALARLRPVTGVTGPLVVLAALAALAAGHRLWRRARAQEPCGEPRGAQGSGIPVDADT